MNTVGNKEKKIIKQRTQRKGCLEKKNRSHKDTKARRKLLTQRSQRKGLTKKI